MRNFGVTVLFVFAQVLLTTSVTANATSSFDLIERDGSTVKMRAACGISGLSPCAQVIPIVRASVFDQVKKHVDAAYQGKLLDLTGSGKKSGTGFVSNEFIQTPICNLKDHVYANEAGSTSKNHNDESCGLPCRFSCSAGGGGKVSCSMDNAKSTSCSLERALTRGALIQTIWHEYDQVVKELSEPAGGNRLALNSTCQGIVTDPLTVQVFKNATEEIQRFQTINKGREVSCPVPGASPTPTPSQTVVGEQAGCYLAASRATLENLIATVATCEVFSRAWQSFQPDSIVMKKLPSALIDEARLAPSCAGMRSDATQFQACLNTYYEANVGKHFLKQMESFGNAPLERPTPSASSK